MHKFEIKEQGNPLAKEEIICTGSKHSLISVNVKRRSMRLIGRYTAYKKENKYIGKVKGFQK